MRKNNKGLTVKINLWALDKKPEAFTSKYARLWIRGQATNAHTGEAKMFNDAGQLLSILGKWNVVKFKEIRDSARPSENGSEAGQSA
jgi:hypothetical protein